MRGRANCWKRRPRSRQQKTARLRRAFTTMNCIDGRTISRWEAKSCIGSITIPPNAYPFNVPIGK